MKKENSLETHWYHFDRDRTFSSTKTACGIWVSYDETDLINPTCEECKIAKDNEENQDDIPF